MKKQKENKKIKNASKSISLIDKDIKLKEFVDNPINMQNFNSMALEKTYKLDKYLNKENIGAVEAYFLLKNFIMNLEIKYFSNECDKEIIEKINSQAELSKKMIQLELNHIKGKEILENNKKNKKENVISKDTENKRAKYIG